MAACAELALHGTEWIANVWPDGYLLGRRWLLYAFAPLTAAGTLVSAVLWTRRLRPSVIEAMAALLIAEIVAWRVVADYYGAWFGPYFLLFWAAGNVVFAPWWPLGFWIGRSIERRAPPLNHSR